MNWCVWRQDETPKPSLTKIARINDQANALLNPPRPLTKPLPEDLLAVLKTMNNFILRHRISDIPDSVRTAFAKAAEEETFSMANREVIGRPQTLFLVSHELGDV